MFVVDFYKWCEDNIKCTVFLLSFFIYDNEYATISVLMKRECIYDIHFILCGSHLELKQKTKEFLSGEWGSLLIIQKNIHIKYYTLMKKYEFIDGILFSLCVWSWNGWTNMPGVQRESSADVNSNVIVLIELSQIELTPKLVGLSPGSVPYFQDSRYWVCLILSQLLLCGNFYLHSGEGPCGGSNPNINLHQIYWIYWQGHCWGHSD